MTFGEILSQRRKAQGWSQERLAQRLGMTRQSLIALEHDRRGPSLAMAMAIAQLFNTSLDGLLGGLSPGTEAPPPHRWLGPMPTFPSPVVWSLVQNTLVLVPTPLLASPRLPDAIWDPHADQLIPMPAARDARRVILVGGCDPFIGWLQERYETTRPGYAMDAVQLSSQAALTAFQQGLLHVAGSHLYDAISGRYNQLELSGSDAIVAHPYLRWEEGLMFHDQAPSIRRLAIREIGSEAHALYRRHQAASPWPTEVFYSHQSILDYIQHHSHWAGVGLGSLAATRGLHFEAWALESYDLFIRQSDQPTAWAETFTQVAGSVELQQRFRAIPHIELSVTGT